MVQQLGQKLPSDLPKAKEVILHVGVDDVATGPPKQIVHNFDDNKMQRIKMTLLWLTFAGHRFILRLHTKYINYKISERDRHRMT